MLDHRDLLRQPLQPYSGPLQLRIVGTSRDGQQLEMRSSRITIGNAENCTLRLRSSHIRPIQCLIVRKPTATTIWNLAPGTLLNGQPFRESALFDGDCIQVGPVVLEVMGLGFFPPEFSPESVAPLPTGDASPVSGWAACRELPDSPAADWISDADFRTQEIVDRLERLEQSLRELDPQPVTDRLIPDEIEPWEAGVLETVELPEPFAVDPWLVSGIDPTRIKDELQDLRRQQATVSDQIAKVERDALELRSCCDDILRARHACEEEVRGLHGSFDSQLSQMLLHIEEIADGLRSRFDARQVEVQDVLQLMRLELEQMGELTAEARRHRDELQAEVHQLLDHATQLEQRVLDLEAAPPAAADVDHVTPDGVTETSSEQLEANSVASSLESVTRSEPALRFQAGTPRRHQELAWLAAQLASSPAEEQTSSENSAAEVAALPDTLEQSSEAIVQESDRTVAQPASFDDEARDELGTDDLEASSRENLIVALPEPESRIPEAVALDAVALREHPAAEPAVDDESSTEEESEEDVFARLSRAGIWKQPESADEGVGEDLEAVGVVKELDAAESPPIPSGKRTGPGEEDSIESYMQRLLERVRGDSERPGILASSIPVERPEGPIMEMQLVAEPEPEEPRKLTESEFQPRSQAPEMNSNLAAMRALANASRDKSILVHAQRTSSDQVLTKLLGAAAGVTTALAASWFLESQPIVAGFGIAIGGTAALVFLWQAVRFRKRLYDSLRLSDPPQAGSENEPVEPRRGLESNE